MDERTERFLAGLDEDRIRAEHQHRHSGLVNWMGLGCRRLRTVLGDEAHDVLVGAYADDEAFVTPRGRSLPENYCLWAYDVLRARSDDFAAQVAKLDGVVSGIKQQPGAPSPWPGHRRHASLPLEAFASSHAVLDEQGAPVDESNVATLRQAPPTKVFLLVGFDDAGDLVVRQTSASSVPTANR
ncbi:MAG: hypothetical protein H6712_32060 [Myxococcales bacterium]|nr:hypothetical protein [Myxococcales bacterium]